MSSHFSPKSLAFYGVAIGSVVTLFTVTTRYGEASLQAPRTIEGSYGIAANTLPGCLGDRPLNLAVQQSGIYLTGTLLPTDVDERTARIAKERPALTGRWNNEQLTLAGPLTHLSNCTGTIQIQGTIQQDKLTGAAQLDAASPAASFTAQRQPDSSSEEAGSH